MKSRLLLCLFLASCLVAEAQTIDTNYPQDTESIANGANRVREFKTQVVSLLSQIFANDGSTNFLSGWVTQGMLKSNFNGSAILASRSIQGTNLALGSVGSNELATAAVQPANIAPGAVGNAALGVGSVQPTNIASGALNSPIMFGAGAVPQSALAAGIKLPHAFISIKPYQGVDKVMCYYEGVVGVTNNLLVFSTNPPNLTAPSSVSNVQAVTFQCPYQWATGNTPQTAQLVTYSNLVMGQIYYAHYIATTNTALGVALPAVSLYNNAFDAYYGTNPATTINFTTNYPGGSNSIYQPTMFYCDLPYAKYGLDVTPIIIPGRYAGAGSYVYAFPYFAVGGYRLWFTNSVSGSYFVNTCRAYNFTNTWTSYTSVQPLPLSYPQPVVADLSSTYFNLYSYGATNNGSIFANVPDVSFTNGTSFGVFVYQ